MLIDSQKRQVYDIYGLEGLTSGLQVGSHLRSREELRQEWERFKAQQARKRPSLAAPPYSDAAGQPILPATCHGSFKT